MSGKIMRLLTLVASLLLVVGLFASAPTAQEEGTEEATTEEAADDTATEEVAEEGPTAPEAYVDKCGRCHNPDGSATRIGTRFESPHLGSAEVQALTAAEVEASIVEGRPNMRAMTDIPPEDMAAIVEWTLSLEE